VTGVAVRGLQVVAGGVRLLDVLEPSLLVLDTPVIADARRWTAAARRRGIRVASIHDLGIAPVPSDLAIDGSVNAGAIAGALRTLTGPRYALVDPRCAGARHSAADEHRVLIALGGGPRRRAARRIAAAIRKIAPASRIDIAAGFSPDRAGTSDDSVRWLGPQRSLVPHFCRARVAVVAGGVTSYEAASVGVPAVALAVVPAQRRTIRGLAAAGAVVDSGVTLGTSGSVRVDEARAIAVRVRQLMLSGRRNAAAGRAGRALVDGRGIERVARALMALGCDRRSAA
jgi:spore coat polysaccharide biosynthesis predicted glycosyltransferase SpsG